MKKAVDHYNTRRAHNHLKRMTPQSFENKWNKGEFLYPSVITIFNNEENKTTKNNEKEDYIFVCRNKSDDEKSTAE